MNKWISVEDKYPPHNIPAKVKMKCFVDDSEVEVTLYHTNEEDCDWRFADDRSELNEMAWQVTHWMPLPEPPEEEK